MVQESEEERHSGRGCRVSSANAVASTNIYYGSGFTNAFPGQPDPGGYLPGHTTFRPVRGEGFWRKVLGVGERPECGKSPRGAGQQRYVRRVSLEQSAGGVCGGAVAVSVLRF